MTYNALPPLKGVWGKIRRAKVHRDALDVYITETFADEANRPLVGAKLEPESGDYIHYISRMPDLEPFLLEVGLRFGDAIHNLRSALNHLVMQLALLPKRKRTITPGQTLSIEFPINVSCGSFDKDWKRCCRHVDPAQRATFEKFQPYDTRTSTGLPDTYVGPWVHPLRLLRDFSNQDKHRVIVATVLNPGSYSARGRTGTGAFVSLMHVVDRLQGRTFIRPERLELGTVILRGSAPGGMRPADVEVDGDMTPDVCLSEFRPVVQTLDRISAFVIHVVREFEPLF